MNRVFVCRNLVRVLLGYIPEKPWTRVQGSSILVLDAMGMVQGLLPFRLVNKTLSKEALFLFFELLTKRGTKCCGPDSSWLNQRLKRFPEVLDRVEALNDSADWKTLEGAINLKALILFSETFVSENVWARIEHLTLYPTCQSGRPIRLPETPNLRALVFRDFQVPARIESFPEQLTYLSVPLVMISGPLPKTLRKLRLTGASHLPQMEPLDLQLPESLETLKSKLMMSLVHREYPRLFRTRNILFKDQDGQVHARPRMQTTYTAFIARVHDPSVIQWLELDSRFNPALIAFPNLTILAMSALCVNIMGNMIESSQLPPSLKHLWFEQGELLITGPVPNLESLCCYSLERAFDSDSKIRFPENLKAYVQQDPRPILASWLPGSLIYLACQQFVQDRDHNVAFLHAAWTGNRKTGFARGLHPHRKQKDLIRFLEALE